MVSIVLDPDAHGIIPVDLGPIAYLMLGLAPTLIIVRVGYRKSVNSVQQMVSIHFAEHDSQEEVGNRALQTTLDIHLHPQHVDVLSDSHEEDGTAGEKLDGSRIA
ncbi:hypothetical protein PQX77_021788 [Marasmius sp. AFHP31]|nr:hypothetical protein PQX77_021788 [Marasmius sp. AFHP31]